MRILVTFDAKAMEREIAGLDEAGRGEFRTRLVGEINRIGAEVHGALIEPLKAQTGLHGSTIPRAVHDVWANEQSLAYTAYTEGGNIALKYFDAFEVGDGVTAFPEGVATHLSGAFMTSGRAPNRKESPKLGGHVYRNVAGGAWKGKVKKVKSGVYIPKEMVKGPALAAFERVAAAGLTPLAGRVMTMIIGR